MNDVQLIMAPIKVRSVSMKQRLSAVQMLEKAKNKKPVIRKEMFFFVNSVFILFLLSRIQELLSIIDNLSKIIQKWKNILVSFINKQTKHEFTRESRVVDLSSENPPAV